MNLSDALNDSFFNFPVEASSFFPSHLETLFARYLEIIKSVDDEFMPIVQKHLPDIQETCDNLVNATDSVFKGNSSNAYDIFSKIMSKLEQYLVYPNKNALEMNPTHLFKARRNMDNQFELKDMFHVPFEKRYEIQTTRFSLPGVPCLYLSNSIYSCWEELDRPPFGQMAVSRFELSGKNFRFLDFSNSKDFIKHGIVRRPYVPHPKITEEQTNEMFESTLKLISDFVLPRYIQTFPLMTSCYVKVFNKSHHFKPEYIFPQMVMQWIMTQDDIDGIKYLSTKSRPLEEGYRPMQSFLNYAIPIHEYKEQGYCGTMVKRVGLTEPLTYELFSIGNPAISTKEIDYEKDVKGQFFPSPIFYVNFGEKTIPYMRTTFGILEHELMKRQIKKIEN
jgi:hypothetical protein